MLTTRQAADRLQVKLITIQRWLKSGKLRGVKVPDERGDWRIEETEIERLQRGEP